MVVSTIGEITKKKIKKKCEPSIYYYRERVLETEFPPRYILAFPARNIYTAARHTTMNTTDGSSRYHYDDNNGGYLTSTSYQQENNRYSPQENNRYSQQENNGYFQQQDNYGINAALFPGTAASFSYDRSCFCCYSDSTKITVYEGSSALDILNTNTDGSTEGNTVYTRVAMSEIASVEIRRRPLLSPFMFLAYLVGLVILSTLCALSTAKYIIYIDMVVMAVFSGSIMSSVLYHYFQQDAPVRVSVCMRNSGGREYEFDLRLAHARALMDKIFPPTTRRGVISAFSDAAAVDV